MNRFYIVLLLVIELLLLGCGSCQDPNSNCYPLEFESSEWRIPNWKNLGVWISVCNDYGWWHGAAYYPNEDGCIELDYPEHVVVKYVGLTREEFRSELVKTYRKRFKDPFVQWYFCGSNGR